MGENNTLVLAVDASAYGTATKKVRTLDKMVARTEKRAKLFNKTLKSSPGKGLSNVCASLEKINDLLESISVKRKKILETPLNIIGGVGGNRLTVIKEERARSPIFNSARFINKVDSVLAGFRESFVGNLTGFIGEHKKVIDDAFTRIDPYIAGLQTAMGDLGKKFEETVLYSANDSKKGKGLVQEMKETMPFFEAGVSVMITLLPFNAPLGAIAGALITAIPLIIGGTDKLISKIKEANSFQSLAEADFRPSMIHGVIEDRRKDKAGAKDMQLRKAESYEIFGGSKYFQYVGSRLQNNSLDAKEYPPMVRATDSLISANDLEPLMKMPLSEAGEERTRFLTDNSAKFLNKLDSVLTGFTEGFAGKLQGSIVQFQSVIDDTFKRIDPFIVSLETALGDLGEKMESLSTGRGSSNSNDGAALFGTGISVTTALIGSGVAAWPALLAGALVVASPLINKGLDKFGSFISKKISKIIDDFEPMNLNYFADQDKYQPSMFRGVDHRLKMNNLIDNSPGKKVNSSDVLGDIKYYQDVGTKLRQSFNASNKDKLLSLQTRGMELYNAGNKQFNLSQVSGHKSNTQVNVYMDGAVKAQLEVKNEADVEKLAQQTSSIVALKLRNVIANAC